MLLSAHSGFRYIVLLLCVAVIAYASYGMATKRAYDTRMRVLAAAFTASLYATVILGVALLFTGRFYSQLGGHIAMMAFALVVAHVVYSVMRRRQLEARTYAPHLVAALIVLALVWFGIAAIGRPIVG